jgi:hypothetical protein
MVHYTGQVVFRITDQDEQKLRQLTDAAMASPSETFRYVIRGVTVEEMEAIRERVLRQQGR